MHFFFIEITLKLKNLILSLIQIKILNQNQDFEKSKLENSII